MATIRFKSLKGGFSYQRDSSSVVRFINKGFTWTDNATSKNISFTMDNGSRYVFSSDDTIIVNDSTLTGSHSAKVASLESDILIHTTTAAT